MAEFQVLHWPIEMLDDEHVNYWAANGQEIVALAYLPERRWDRSGIQTDAHFVIILRIPSVVGRVSIATPKADA